MARKPRNPALAFQDDTALLDPNRQAALLDQIKAAGGRDIRANLIYGRTKAEGYGQYDQLVNAARQRGLHVQMTLMGTPSYSPQWDQSLGYKHTNPRLMQQFAADTAAHFRGRVGRYSVWNEPNWGGFISDADKNPRQAARRYRQMYQAGYKGIKRADKSAQVLLGEMTAQPNAKEFLKYLLAGKPLKTAGFAYHPYDSPGKPTKTWDIDTLAELQATLGRYKRQGKLQTAQGKQAPLYLTEMGYLKSDVPNEQVRAQKMARAYALARKAGARQFLSYQMAATAPKVGPAGAPVFDAYGGMTPGAPGQVQPGGAWDTSVAPVTLSQAIRRRGRR